VVYFREICYFENVDKQFLGGNWKNCAKPSNLFKNSLIWKIALTYCEFLKKLGLGYMK
jgi:hypothetical protein